MEHQCVKLTLKLKTTTELPTRPRTASCLNEGGGGCVGMGDIRKSTLVVWCITWERQFPSKHCLHYILHSHHHYNYLIQSASRQPTVHFSLLVDFVIQLPSCKRFAFIRFHSTGNSLVLITHARIRSGRGQSYSSEFTSRKRPMPTGAYVRFDNNKIKYTYTHKQHENLVVEYIRLHKLRER